MCDLSGCARRVRPLTMPRFQAVQRFWDSATRCWTARVRPGEHYVTRSDEVISTVIGSCICACVGDPILKLGGMTSFMLPLAALDSEADSEPDRTDGLATSYANQAMARLLGDLLKLGARRERLEIKLFGAARLLGSATDQGARNISLVQEYAHAERLCVVATDVGNIFPRRVIYNPASGKVRVRRLPVMDGPAIAEREQRYLNDIVREHRTGNVEALD